MGSVSPDEEELPPTEPATRHALLVATPQGEVVFGTTEAKQWLKEYCGRPAKANLLPRKVSRWLSADGSRGARRSLVLKHGAKRLFVRRIGPEAGNAIALLLELPQHEGGRAPRQHAPVTTRENDVLRWIAAGKSDREIAAILELARGTVSKHVEHILLKLGVENRTAAASFYDPPA